jgi:hypothetical protein
VFEFNKKKLKKKQLLNTQTFKLYLDFKVMGGQKYGDANQDIRKFNE